MPFVKVFYPEIFYNKENLEKVSEGIHQSLIEHFNIPEDDYFQMFFPYQANHFFYNSFYLLEEGKKRDGDMIYVSITCGPGRTIKEKSNLYHSISVNISNYFSISNTDIFITLHETPAENWSFGQGIPQLVTIKEENKG